MTERRCGGVNARERRERARARREKSGRDGESRVKLPKRQKWEAKNSKGKGQGFEKGGESGKKKKGMGDQKRVERKEETGNKAR